MAKQDCILAFETSCDDTSVAIVKDGRTCLSSLVSSQIKAHQPFGGVVPELASRMHTEKIHRITSLALKEANLTFKDITSVAVTYGPGLEGSLLIGLAAAKAVSAALSVPLIPVNHLHGHLYAAFLESGNGLSFPFIGCIVSGGHSSLVLAKGHFDFEIIGETRDDAAGEAFDKVSRALGLGYPGGPVVEKMALEGNPKAFAFPRAMRKQGLEFSFSGLKTAVIQTIQGIASRGEAIPVADICASFQAAVCDSIVEKSLAACEQYHVPRLMVCGGVSANKYLGDLLTQRCQSAQIELMVPSLTLCTDNAAMIAVAAYYLMISDRVPSGPVIVNPNLEI